MKLRLLLLLTGMGALLTGAPSFALIPPSPGSGPTTATSPVALRLLESAAEASRTRTWTGIQRVVTVRGGLPRFTVLQVQHSPGEGSAVRVLSSDEHAVAADVLDAKLLGLLAGHYDLVLAGAQSCCGRHAQLVEVRRPGVTGAAAVAGRFWLDESTGMVLRRDVLDQDGGLVRSSTFDHLRVGATIGVQRAAAQPLGPTGQRLDDNGLGDLESEGWPVARTLPSGLELFDARMHDNQAGDVLQLSYSDGLSTLSLFVQKGELPDDPGGTARPVEGGTVWVRPGPPERVVWSGDGRTWTLVSDAPEVMVSDALLALPHTPASVDDSAASRLWRGMSVVGAWLNPFD